VDVSLLDSVAALLTYQASRWFATGDVPSRTGNRHATIAPYDTFDVAGGVLVLAVGNDEQWQRLCRALARSDLAADGRFLTNAGRVRHYDALRALLAPVLAADSRDRWIARLRAAGVPCGAVRSIEEALSDPQLLAREMIAVVDHPALGPLRMLGVPVKLAGTPGAIRTPPPALGEHTAAVLRSDLGLTTAEIDALAAGGAIRLAT
jgi:formyl-CoA transferase/CoA:oxalate CoA-transferase